MKVLMFSLFTIISGLFINSNTQNTSPKSENKDSEIIGSCSCGSVFGGCSSGNCGKGTTANCVCGVFVSTCACQPNAAITVNVGLDVEVDPETGGASISSRNISKFKELFSSNKSEPISGLVKIADKLLYAAQNNTKVDLRALNLESETYYNKLTVSEKDLIKNNF